MLLKMAINTINKLVQAQIYQNHISLSPYTDMLQLDMSVKGNKLEDLILINLVKAKPISVYIKHLHWS
jgi:hypothetical protein